MITLFSFVFGLVLLFATTPLPVSAALTENQIQSVLELLQSFGADGPAVSETEAALRGTSVSSGKVAVKSQGIFTVRGETPSGTYKLNESIVLGTFSVFAQYHDLDGSTFRIDSTFSKSEDLSKPRSLGLTYDCPAIIKRGTVGTCIAKVRFVEPAVYYYQLQNPSIERPNAQTYAPEKETMFIGKGTLDIPWLMFGQ